MILAVFTAALWGESGLLDLLPLALVALVLEPDLDLGLRKVQHAGQLLPFMCYKVFLHCKSPLQFVDLCVGKVSTWASLL